MPDTDPLSLSPPHHSLPTSLKGHFLSPQQEEKMPLDIYAAQDELRSEVSAAL
jgi:hypothetical protein